jgi:hypothetical protein
MRTGGGAGSGDEARVGKPPLRIVRTTSASPPGRGSGVNAGMTSLSGAHLAGILAAYDFAGCTKIVDVAGGHGALSESYRGAVRSTVFEDLPAGGDA